MTFAAPIWLWLALAVPILGALSLRGRKQRRASWIALGKRGDPPARREWPMIAAFVFALIAAADPRWGASASSKRSVGRDLVIAIDSSWSMAAEGRLAVAQRAAVGLIRALPSGDRCGVVTFSGRASARCPVTDQIDAAIDAVNALRAGELTPGGSDLGAAVEASLGLLSSKGETRDASSASKPQPLGVIVLFSDGEDHNDGWKRGEEELRRSGAILHAVAVGDPERASRIPLPNAGVSLKRDGREVLSARQDAPLRALADASGGAWIPAGLAPFDAGSLYLERIRPIEPSRNARRSALTSPAERFSLFAVLSLALMTMPWGAAAASVSKATRRAGLTGMAILTAAALGAADNGGSFYVNGRYEEAAREFENDRRSAPDHPVPCYNLAAALYQSGRYAEALALYQEARAKSNVSPALRAKIDLALGNTALALGNLDDAVAHYERCLGEGDDVPEAESVRVDAAINRRRAEELRNVERAQPKDRRPDANREPRVKPATKPGDSSADALRTDASNGPKQGGAGGAEAARQSERLDPVARLKNAMESIRQARSHRAEEASSPMVSGSSQVKDW